MTEKKTESRHELIVDRIEGDRAVVEVDGAYVLELPRWLLPAETSPDDLLIVVTRAADAGTVEHKIRVDHAATAEAQREARGLVERLRGRDTGGDIVI